MKQKNYYNILGVSETATYFEIKRAYYHLCKKYHPDINPDTTEKFKEINEAYETLINPTKRKSYDNSLNNTEYQSSYSEYTHSANTEYYQNPENEPIYTILSNFSKFKFETAINAIWKRNIFVLYGNSILYAFISILSIINCITKWFKKSILPNKTPKTDWLNHIYSQIKYTKLYSLLMRVITLSTISACKTIYLTFKITMFIYSHIIKPLLIPLAIVLASIIFSKNNNKKYY